MTVQVYKGIKEGVHEVAIKIFPAIISPRDLESLQREIAVLRSCNNKNIVHFYGVCFKGLDAWLVMELLEKGNLYNALAYGKGLCTWYQRCAALRLSCMYLHAGEERGGTGCERMLTQQHALQVYRSGCIQ